MYSSMTVTVSIRVGMLALPSLLKSTIGLAVENQWSVKKCLALRWKSTWLFLSHYSRT